MGLGKLGLAADQISPIDKLHAHRPAPRFTPPKAASCWGAMEVAALHLDRLGIRIL
jgi:hypothetical protein